MKTYVCKRWDTLHAIAATHHVPPSRIWDDPGNDSIRRRRVYTDALLSGDRLVVPEFDRKDVGSGTGRELDVWVEQKVPGYRVQLLVDGEPCAGAVCRLDNQIESTVTTDGDGRFELFVCDQPELRREYTLHVNLPERTSPRARPARRRTLRVVFGHLENELDFLQSFLTNLGFHCLEVRPGVEFGPEDPLPRRTEAAFLRFGRVFGLLEDKPPVLRDRTLRQIHGSESDQRIWRGLLSLHSQDASLRKLFRWEDKLAPLSHPLVRLFSGPPWNRINLLEGPQLFVDAHMHINSGKCAPWPLVWDKDAMLDAVRPSHGMARAGVEGVRRVDARVGRPLSRWKPLDFASIGEMETQRIAADSVKLNADAIALGPHLDDDDYLSLLVPLPMDMDFAHIDGYEKKQLYQPWSERYERPAVGVRPALSPPPFPVTPQPVPTFEPLPPGERLAKPDPKIRKVTGAFYSSSATYVRDGDRLATEDFWLNDEEFDDYQPYPQQIEDTLSAAAAHPWNLLPLYHYDPRRWSPAAGERPASRVFHYKRRDFATGEMVDAQKTLEGFPRHWSEPFDRYFKPGGPRQFIGIKLYTALGYRPMDPFLETTQRALYEMCVSDELRLPVVCHCTPAGMYSVERSLYVIKDCERLGSNDARKAELARRREQTIRLLHGRVERNAIDVTAEDPAWPGALSGLHNDWGTFWFSEQYVSPWAWRPVLEKYPALRLSLAHFGGDDPPYTHWARQKPPIVRTDLLELGGRADANEELLWDDQLVALALRYEHFHIDLSYFPLSRERLPRLDSMLQTYPQLVDKLLFGTDWWMIEKSKIKYPDFVATNRKLLTELNPELWERLACVNPVKFYRLRENAEAIAEGLRMGAEKLKNKDSRKSLTSTISQGLELLRRLQ